MGKERGKKGGWREAGRTGQRRKERDRGTSSGQKRKKAKTLSQLPRPGNARDDSHSSSIPTPLTNSYSFYKTKFLLPYSEQSGSLDWLR